MSDRPKVSAAERAAAALVGYTAGTVVVLPFDRVKSLLQVSASSRQIGALEVARREMQRGGIRSLYRGGTAHMLIAPYTVFYYSLYDEILGAGKRATTATHGHNGHPLLPLGAALIARTAETTVRQPLELVRTIMQTSSNEAETLPGVVRALRAQPVSAWFRGLVPTLLRDVPFSATYWLLYETMKHRVKLSEETLSSATARMFVQSLVCGAGSGIMAALVCAPLDVIKTVRQHQTAPVTSYADILRSIRQTPQLAFAGLGPRLIRIPAGLATMMAGIEVTKLGFEQRRARLNAEAADESLRLRE